MSMVVHATALHFLVLTVAGWLSRREQAAIAYLREENRVLRSQLGSKRLGLTDGQRRSLAEKGKPLGAPSGTVVRRKRLGGLLSHYEREAA
jgi:hypothetical protein